MTVPHVAVLEAFDGPTQARLRDIVGDRLRLVLIPDNGIQSRRNALAQADYAVVRSVPLEAELVAGAPRLKLIHQWGTGTDGIPLDAAQGRGIVVARSPGLNAPSVADLTIGLMLAIRRRIPQADARIRAGGWAEPDLYSVGRDLCGAKVGLVGLGAIGRQVMRRLLGFDCEIAYTRSSGPDPAVPGYMELDQLIGWADVLSLHLPLSAPTRHLIDRNRLARMPSGSFLVNTARGGLVDEVALADALSAHHLGGAAIDAFSEEPPRPGNPLLSAPNVVLSAHSGGRCRENFHRIVRHWTVNILAHSSGETLDPSCVVVQPEGL
ncbi:2-hydroxyacid dehydrogenase [Paracoccus beibuensis]|uniref:2-hydroxyacid dehydrogenase n=1 Tax=Paracoccus beibuensis TaxID=547602 RepID=UPI00223EBE66|nr:2-hydroxyacid dehydrogenase [Paracoccus beibuensis]